MSRSWFMLVGCSVFSLACGGGGGDATDSDGSTTGSTSSPTQATGMTETETGDPTQTPSGSESETGTTEGPTTDPSTTDPSTTDPSTTDPSTTDPSTTDPTDPTDPSTTDPSTTDPSTTDPSDSDSDSDSDSGTTGQVCDPNMGGDIDFSYIWIANSPEGTVSKIDTETLDEVARYQVRPQGGGLPSRTSVNLDGDVVIASRDGGVTKIYAREDDCVDSNGIPGIQTSTGKNDVLPWDQEECVAWYTDYNFLSERAIAWTTGEYNDVTCEFEDPKVWVGATNDQVNLKVLRLNGDTGEQEDEITIPGTQGFMSRSPYGAAVDADNDVWMVNAYCGGTLIEVHNDDLTYDTIQVPGSICPYGIAVDAAGYIWIGGYQTFTGRYDPDNQTWDTVQAQGLGIQEDASGRMWLGAYGQNGVYAIDSETLEVLKYVSLNQISGQTKGVSIDFFGYVWVVGDAGGTAVRLDPETDEVQAYTGLNSPYSYSDMTGWGLKNAVIPQ